MTDGAGGRTQAAIDRRWIALTLAAWVAIAAFWLVSKWNGVHWLALGDTDDNMRLMQVRALLDGQGWYDLRQYRLNPPQGFDIHWSRLVDLPIAGLILAFQPFVGTAWAERLACGIAPILPLSIAMLALSFTARRLIAPAAWPVALIVMFGATAAMLMFMPMRIDHHGWQLAMLAITVAGLADRRGARGGAVVGLATATSLTIGLEMLPYGAMAGAILALRWVWDRDEARRLAAYALALGGGSALGFVVFASNANYAMRCDALTPVWLSVVAAGGGVLFALAWSNPRDRRVRLALALVAGAALAGGFATLFPQCLSRPEGVSDELARTWLNNVREAKPIYRHPLRNALPIAALPVMGLLGALVATWRARATPRGTLWAPVALFTAFAVAMMLWQVRAGPAAQLLAVPGAAALAWVAVPWCLRSPHLLVRVFGSVAAFITVSGLFAGLAIKWLPIDRPDKRAGVIARAGGQCQSLPRLRMLDRFPPMVMFTHVDMGPRLIATTHHDAIAGPYHRNGDAILDVHHAFQGTPEAFRTIAKRHGARVLLVCPNLAETTVYRARAPRGFYAQLAKGRVPPWLVRVPLPKGAPYRMWRIDYVR